MLTNKSVRAALSALAASAFISYAAPSEQAAAPLTPLPAGFRLYEMHGKQYLYVYGRFAGDQAFKLPTSQAITNDYGLGWMPMEFLVPQDFVDAAAITKKAQGDLRNAEGPYVGVIQLPVGTNIVEPSVGWENLDSSVPFVDWGPHSPNNGVGWHSSFPLDSFLKSVSHVIVAWTAGDLAGAAGPTNSGAGGMNTALVNSAVTNVDAVLDTIISYLVSDPKAENYSNLYHEKDGTVSLDDSTPLKFRDVLLWRFKPVSPPPTGPLPSWPKVNGKTNLVDGMIVSRRSYLSWKWGNGARLGQIQIVNTRTGVVAIDRSTASTPQQALTTLRPDPYLIRIRDISKYSDPFLEIGFVTK